MRDESTDAQFYDPPLRAERLPISNCTNYIEENTDLIRAEGIDTKLKGSGAAEYATPARKCHRNLREGALVGERHLLRGRRSKLEERRLTTIERRHCKLWYERFNTAKQ